MQISIFGAGAVGLGLAAYWMEMGHKVSVVSLSGKGRNRLSPDAILTSTGRVTGKWPIAFATPEQAVRSAELVVVAQQVAGHRGAVDITGDNLQPGQSVLVSSALAFETSRLVARLAERSIDAAIGATPVPPINARMSGPAEVLVSRIKDKVEIFSAASHRESLRQIVGPLLPMDLAYETPLVGADLNNINPMAHYANALCNFTRIEMGEAWKVYAGYTPHAGRLIDALDLERKALGDKLGVTTRSTAEYFAEWNEMPGKSVAEVSQAVVERQASPPGPANTDNRYVFEDVPYGLVPLEELGRTLGVSTPLISGGIEIFSALYGIDLRNFTGTDTAARYVAGVRNEQKADVR